MNAPFKILAAAVSGLLLGLPAAQADEYFPMTDVFVHFGTGQNELTVNPPDLTLQVGELYRIIVINPSENTHVVAAPELAMTGNTIDLLKGTPRVDFLPGKIAAGISLQPGQMMEWTFMALEAGTYKLGCDDPVHALSGMHTTIKVAL